MNDRPLILIGGGGHARVLIDALRLVGATILGLCDPALSAGGKGPLGVPVLGGDEALTGHSPEAVFLVNAIGSVQLTAKRRDRFQQLSARGYRFAVVRHPSVIVGADVELGEGTQLMAGTVVQSGTRLGINVLLNTRVSVDHDCRLGDHVHIAPGATLSGNVVVGESTHVGAGAVIIQGVRVGKGCLIGAGAVALKDVPDGATLITPQNRTTAGPSA